MMKTLGFVVNFHVRFPSLPDICLFFSQARASDEDTDNRLIGQQLYVNIRVSLTPLGVKTALCNLLQHLISCHKLT